MIDHSIYGFGNGLHNCAPWLQRGSGDSITCRPDAVLQGLASRRNSPIFRLQIAEVRIYGIFAFGPGYAKSVHGCIAQLVE